MVKQKKWSLFKGWILIMLQNKMVFNKILVQILIIRGKIVNIMIIFHSQINLKTGDKRINKKDISFNNWVA